jgi:hypothetical protein
MNNLSGLHQNLNVISEGQIPESEYKIDQKKNDWKSKSKQKAQPKFVQSGWFSICGTHITKISIFA